METDLIKKTIFGKYKVLKVLGKGAFGKIFQGVNILTNEQVAIKAEDWKVKGEFLEGEAYILYYLRNFGIPEIKSFGTYKKYKILVQNLLGDNLDTLFLNDEEKKLNFKDICMIAIQLIDRLEYIHSKYVIHRDLKPENLLIDLETGTIIYLIDFGMAKKYRSGKTKKHIKFQITKKFTGTLRYSSVNATRGAELSRRDDLESAGYVLIYLSQRRYLPWIGLTAKNKRDKFYNNYKMKKNMKEEILCKYLPKQFCDYMKYVKKLKFEEDPDYNYLRWLFLNLLISLKCQNDLKFGWNSDKKDKSRNASNPKYARNDLLLKRKYSPHSRILRNIKNSKEKENKMKNIEPKKADEISYEKQNIKIKDISEKSNKIEMGEISSKNNDDLNNDKTSENAADIEEQKDELSDIVTKNAQFNVDVNMEDLDEAKSNDANSNIKNEKLNLDEFKIKNYKNINYRGIYKTINEQNLKTFLTSTNDSSKPRDKLNYPKESMNNNIYNISTKDSNKEYKIKGKDQSLKNALAINKLIKEKILLKKIFNKIPKKINVKRINNISSSYYKTLDTKKNRCNKYEIPKPINCTKKKNNFILKNIEITRINNLKQLTPDRVKYAITFNNLDFLNKKLSSKRDPINYNKMNVDNSDIEKKMNFNQNQNNIIQNYRYKKFFINNNSVKQLNSIRMKNISPFKNSIYQNSEYQSIFKARQLQNTINDYNYIDTEKIYNTEILFDTKEKTIPIFRNRSRRDNTKKSGFIPNQKGLLKNFSRKKFFDSNTNNYNNLSFDISSSDKRNLYFYKRPKKYVFDIQKTPKFAASTSNINIKKNYIFPINYYLDNSKSYKKKTTINAIYNTYSTNNY